jgi:hypothetical protein
MYVTASGHDTSAETCCKVQYILCNALLAVHFIKMHDTVHQQGTI